MQTTTDFGSKLCCTETLVRESQQLHTKYAVHDLVHRKLHFQYFCAHGEQVAERTPLMV